MGPATHHVAGESTYELVCRSADFLDPQIVSLQCLHYLSLSLILPVLLSTFASRPLLAYEGGPSSVSLMMDWREFTGSPTVSLAPSVKRGLEVGLVGLSSFATRKGPGGTGDGGALLVSDVSRGLVRVIERDSARGWTVAAGWLCASMIEWVCPLRATSFSS